MLSNSTLGVGLAAEPNSATLTGGPTSSFPSFSETFPSPSSIPSLPSSSQVAQEVKEDSIDSDSPEDQGINLENSFFDIFGRSPEISLYDMPLPENEITEIVSALKREDLSPFLPNAPPPFSRTTSPYKDALDRAGERAETFLYPMMKLLLSSHAMTSDEDPIRKMIADACLLLEKALKEARHVRIQARFGFTEAAKMKDEFSSTLLTKRQAELLEESKKQEIKEQFHTLRNIHISPSYYISKRKYSKPLTSNGSNKQFFRSEPRTFARKRDPIFYNSRSLSRQRSRGQTQN